MSRRHRSLAADPVCSVLCVSHVDSCGFNFVIAAFPFFLFVLRKGIVLSAFAGSVCVLPSIVFLCLSLNILPVDLMGDCD